VITPELLAQVRRLTIRSRRAVEEVFSGAYRGAYRGQGLEFAEVREYVPGDDVRAIDWNVTARTGEPHIKRFVEERELTVMLLVDVSASQDFGSGRRSKLEAAVELSALLALSARRGAVLDPFAGAGTVGRIAVAAGREWIGVERDPYMAGVAARRLRLRPLSPSRPRARRAGRRAAPRR